MEGFHELVDPSFANLMFGFFNYVGQRVDEFQFVELNRLVIAEGVFAVSTPLLRWAVGALEIVREVERISGVFQ